MGYSAVGGTHVLNTTFSPTTRPAAQPRSKYPVRDVVLRSRNANKQSHATEPRVSRFLAVVEVARHAASADGQRSIRLKSALLSIVTILRLASKHKRT